MGKKKQSSTLSLTDSCNSPVLNHMFAIVNDSELSDSISFEAKLIELQQEIQESLSEIMNEFINDFKTRKDKRLSSKCPISQIHTYNLVVNKSYQKKIRKQVFTLISEGFAEDLQNILIQRITKFVEMLELYLKEIKQLSKILQIIFLYDAYHTLQNASVEIGKIIASIYKMQEKSIEYLFIKAFYTKIVVPSNSLLKQAGDYDKNHFAISGIMKMNTHLSYIMRENISLELSESISQVISENNSENESTECEPLYNLPIDELVTYIEGKNKKKTNKRNNAANSSSPSSDYSELDKEIDEFRKRIDIPLTPCRPSVKLSQEFLDQLRKSLLRNKVN